MDNSIDLSTKEGIDSLQNITSFEDRKAVVLNQPEVVLYAAKFWDKQEADFEQLVKLALQKSPEIIISFKGKNGLVANRDFVETAVLADPMVITKLNAELKGFIDDKMFIKAFIKNPMILSLTDLDVLKHRYARKVTVIENGKVTERRIVTSLRNECLKAIRLCEGSSVYHEGFDDFAKVISKGLQQSRDYQSKKYSTELLQNFATLMNAMIKKGNQKLRAVSAEAWLVNNGKPMYKAIRMSAKEDSSLEGLIADMPTELFPKKVIKKLIIAAILTNPEYYLKLEEYGFKEYKDDSTVKYNVYKSLKRHGMLTLVQNYLDEKTASRAKHRLDGVAKHSHASNETRETVSEEEVKAQ